MRRLRDEAFDAHHAVVDVYTVGELGQDVPGPQAGPGREGTQPAGDIRGQRHLRPQFVRAMGSQDVAWPTLSAAAVWNCRGAATVLMTDNAAAVPASQCRAAILMPLLTAASAGHIWGRFRARSQELARSGGNPEGTAQAIHPSLCR